MKISDTTLEGLCFIKQIKYEDKINVLKQLESGRLRRSVAFEFYYNHLERYKNKQASLSIRIRRIERLFMDWELIRYTMRDKWDTLEQESMMYKQEFCNYGEKAKWARKWIKAKKKKVSITRNFCNAYPERYDIKTWHGRTTARNILVVWANKYKLGKLRSMKTKGNWVPKKQIPLTELDPSDLLVYQEIVEDILKNNDISKDEIAKLIKIKKDKLKNQKKMAEVFGLSRKIFYRKDSELKSTRIKKDRTELAKIVSIFKTGLYKNLGLDATHQTMLKKGLITMDTTVWDIRVVCEQLDLMSNRVGRKRKKPKEKKDTKNLKPNLLKELELLGPNHAWSTDVSYIRVKAGFVYLSTVIDIYSKKILGWSVSGRNDTELVVASIEKALKTSDKPQFIHSDNGYQYTSKTYIAWMKTLNIKISKSAPAKSLENREIEFWFGLLKREHLYKIKLRNIVDTIFEINM